MIIKLEGHSKEYETKAAAMLFFSNDDNVLITSRIVKRKNAVLSQCEIEFENKKFFGDAEGPLNSDSKETSYIVKLAVFRAGIQLGGETPPWGVFTGIRPTTPIRNLLQSGKTEEETERILTEKYCVSAAKAQMGIKVSSKELTLLNNNPKSVSVYIGIPFCPTRCLYCSFISKTVSKQGDIETKYIEHITEEIKKTGEIIYKLGLFLNTVYIGGGTPTALNADLLHKLFRATEEGLNLSSVREFTTEAGRPDTISKEKLEAIWGSKTDRISINPQTLCDDTLKVIGRSHSVQDFFDAFDLARRLGFDNINTDIIAGLPGEDEETFNRTLSGLKKLSPEAITVHTLYLKRASFLKERQISLPSGKTVTNMIDASVRFAEQNDYEPYYLYRQRSTLGNLENVGYSKNGKECIYNMNTMGDAESIIAIGAGGASKVVTGGKIERVFNYKNADDYIKGFDEIISRKNIISGLIAGVI